VARCADATILLVESGVTTRHELYCAAELLERMQVTGIGAVLAELQLRFADASFRTAIASLDRRLLAQTRPVLVPDLAVQVPVAEASVESSREAEAAQIDPEPEEPGLREILHEQPAVQPVNLLNLEAVDANARPFEVAMETPEAAEWQLPGLAAATPAVEESVEEEEAPMVAAAVPILRGFGAVTAAGPVLVETGAVPPEVWENFEEEPAIAIANGTMHEKMAAKLSAHRDIRASSGEAGMTRKTSWLGRLLGRDEGPRFNIVPDADEDGETPKEAVSIASTAAALEPEKSPEYDLPLASRLEQISKQRPAAPLAPPTALPPKNSRLQIVPDAGSEEAAMRESAPRDLAKVAMYRIVKAQDKPVEEAVLPELEQVALEPEQVAAAPVVEAPIAKSPVAEQPVRRLPRPLSFHQLRQAAETARAAAVAERHEPVHEFVEPEAAVEAVAEPALGNVETPTGYEPELAVAPAGEAEVVARLEPEHVEPIHAQPIHVEAIHAQPIHREAVSEEPTPVAESGPDDIEPVFEEASRHLAGGRWDPIPPLRSTRSGWRDRPSPVPASNARVESGSPFGYDRPDPLRRRWTGKDREGAGWADEVPAGVATQTEPLPEPILTRQWGLLSKFQQARASGSRPATGDAAAREYTDSANGNGRGQS
jgi:hypothetical protein